MRPFVLDVMREVEAAVKKERSMDRRRRRRKRRRKGTRKTR